MNQSLGPGLDDLDLPAQVRAALRSRGIVLAAQVFEMFQRRREEHLRQVFGPEFGETRDRLRNHLQRMLPPRLSATLLRGPLPLGSLTGIRGPTTLSARLMERRKSVREERRRVLDRLQRVKRDLPTKVLLTNWMVSKTADQGSLGSCTGFGSVASRQFLAQEHLAPLLAYMMAKRLDDTPGEGSWQHFCFEAFCKWGAVRETDCQYTDSPFSFAIEPYLDLAREFRADGFSDVLLDPDDMTDQPALLKAILSGRLTDELGPQTVSISTAIYESFDSATTSRLGLVTCPLPGESLLGGHAWVIVGYIDAADPDAFYNTTYFLIRNSWGTDWAARNPLGLPGHALIPAQYFMDPKLLWEGLVCLAEPSPVKPAGVLDLLRIAWDPAMNG